MTRRYEYSGGGLESSLTEGNLVRCVFRFSRHATLTVTSEGTGWYELALCRENGADSLPYLRFREASLGVEQPLFCHGGSGEEPCFLVCAEGPDGRSPVPAFSMDEDVLEMYLSVGDSTRIKRLQLDNLKVMAIVTAGSNVQHEWTVDGQKASTEAYFDTFVLADAKVYTVAYRGTNAAGEFTKSFEVEVLERPLEVEFSNTDAVISCKSGETVTIDATVTFGGTGVQHEWKVDGAPVSTESHFSYTFTGEGPYTIDYRAENAKGETVTRQWTVNIQASGLLLDDFESGSLTPWWRTKENDPGITVEDNPKPDAVNSSAKVMRDKVNGTGSTSGYFTLETSKILEGKGIDVTKCTGIRFKVYLGKNKYYPRVDIGGTKYAPVTEPQFKDEWEVLEYRFPFNLDPTKIIQIRPLLQQNGSNIASGAVSDTNTREVYIDDIEFLE